MKKNFRILALLLAMVMLFSACGTAGEDATTSATTAETSATTSEIPSSETTGNGTSESTESTAPDTVETSEVETSEAETSEAETSETETETDYRASISRSREEVEAMLTITDEDFATAAEQLKAFEERALIGDDYDAADALYLEFEDSFYHIATQVSIANIIYNIDMSDTVAFDTYFALYEKYGDTYNSYVDVCKNVYNNSPIRDQLFADWTEEEIQEMLGYDPAYMELSKANEALLDELNNLGDDVFTDRAAEIYAQLVTNNNLMAKMSGYDNYYDYATADIYDRDFGREELALFSDYTVKYFLPNYAPMYEKFETTMATMDEAGYYEFAFYVLYPFDQQPSGTNFLQEYIDSFEGSMYEGMSHMFANRNVVFCDAENSHPTAFQTYLRELEMPFCLFGSQGQDTSTIVHEMGHYYASLHHDDIGSFDLKETQSQGNEMLLLEFMSGKMGFSAYNMLLTYNTVNYMSQIIACIIIDDFEREVYALESVEGYTSADFDAIMDKVCEKFGGAEYVANNLGDMYGYWRQVATNNPVYYISYAVSMTEALNIYAEAKQDRAAGREIYRVLVEDVTDEDGFLGAVTKAGLSSPFAEETFVNILTALGIEIAASETETAQ